MTKTMQYGVYLFDFDGTICDTRRSLLPVFQAGYAVVGRKVTEEEVSRWMRLNLLQSMEDSGIAKEDFPKVASAIIAALDLPESLAMIEPFPEAFEVLRTLKAMGKKVGVVSNNSSAHIRLVLETLGFDMTLDCVVGSDMFQNGKPSPEPIQLALSLLNEEISAKVVYIGDALQDPETAHNAGIAGILVDREEAFMDFSGNRIHDLRALLDAD